VPEVEQSERLMAQIPVIAEKELAVAVMPLTKAETSTTALEGGRSVEHSSIVRPTCKGPLRWGANQGLVYGADPVVEGRSQRPQALSGF